MVIFGVIGVVIGIDEAHDFFVARAAGFSGRWLGLAAEDEVFFGTLMGVLSGAGGIDGEISVDNRGKLAAPAGRAREWGFPLHVARFSIEAADE
jgi:hypothetical protein